VSLGSTKFATGITPVEGLALEVVGTFVLALSALSASSFLQNPISRAVVVGTTLFALIIIIGPLTGGSFNPARTLGPSLFSGYLDNQLIYWVGPLLVAGSAGLIFGSVKRSHGRRKKRLAFVCMCP
jgi:glycerol uptake facilitator-like aquaporin